MVLLPGLFAKRNRSGLVCAVELCTSTITVFVLRSVAVPMQRKIKIGVAANINQHAQLASRCSISG